LAAPVASGLRIATEKAKSGLFERSPPFPTASGRRTTFSACSIHSSMPTNCCFIFRYVFPAVVVVVRCDFRGGRRRVGCARGFRIPDSDRPLAHNYALYRPGTFLAYANRSNMLCDIHFVLGYVFPTVVVVRCDFEEEGELAAPPIASGLRIATPNRPTAYHDAPGRPSTFPACANRLSMPWE
jgi:hypothetical protein